MSANARQQWTHVDSQVTLRCQIWIGPISELIENDYLAYVILEGDATPCYLTKPYPSRALAEADALEWLRRKQTHESQQPEPNTPAPATPVC